MKFSQTSKVWVVLLSIVLLFLWVFLLWYNFYPVQSQEIQQKIIQVISLDNNFTQKAYLVAGWDIMLSRNIGFLNKQNWYDRIFSGQYHPITDFHNCNKKNCLLFFNLESLFNEKDNDQPKAGFDFRANTQNIETLLQLRQDKSLLLSLANNHTINTHYSGLILTKNILDQNQIWYFWAGLSVEEARKIYFETIDDIKLCFATYSYDGQFVKVGAGKMAWNPIKEKDIVEDLHTMKYFDCDAKIISLHWWAEYKIKPNNSQKQLAHKIIDAGADLIIWWHSHVPGTIENYSGKYIIYSLWNFIFDQSWGTWTTNPSYDYIFDYELNKKTTPTYISVLAWFQISKNLSGVNINLDQIVMTRSKDGIHYPLDNQTYEWILGQIKEY